MDTSEEPRAARMKQTARRRFDVWAARFDRSPMRHFLFGPSYLAMLEHIAEWRAGRHEPFSALDIGCGTGAFAKLLLKTRWPISVTGVDLSFAMCSAASENASAGGRILAGDSERLPFPSASFDLVTCANSFHHYPRQQAVVTEMRRVLRPGGAVILLDGFRDNAVGWVVFDVIVTAVEKDVRHASWHEIDAMFRAAGLRNIRRRKHGLLFPVLVTRAEA